MSTKNDWSISDAQAAADESGETIPTYVSVGTPTGECATSIDAADVAKAMQQMEQWPEGQVPSTQVLYVRAASTLAGNTIYSNVVEINTVPYYVELKDAAPLLWYAVGSFIGGGWGNGADQIGNGLMPMFPAKDAEFDKKTEETQLEQMASYNIFQSGILIQDLMKKADVKDNRYLFY